MTTANPILDELWERGGFGMLGLKLLATATRSVIKTHGFPPPDGRAKWTATDVRDVVNDWAFDPVKADLRVRTTVAAVTTDKALARYLEKAILNHLRSEGRKTEFGARLLSVRKHVAKDDRVVVRQDPDVYALLDHDGQPPYAGAHRPLVESAAAVAVQLNLWVTETRRHPIASRDTIMEIVVVVLGQAAAPVMEEVVVHIVLDRCGVSWQFSEITLDDEQAGSVQAGPEDAVLETITTDRPRLTLDADAIWSALCDRQRLLLHALVDDLALRDVEAVLGVPRSTAQRVFGQLRDRLREMFADDPLASDVLQDLTTRSRALASGTEPNGGASPTPVKDPT